MSIDYLFNLSFTLILIYYLFHFQFYKTVALRDCEVAFLQEILRNRGREQIRPALQIPAGPVLVTGDKKPSLQPIIQKVTVTQKVGADKKQRKKKIKKASKKVVTGKRQQYNQLKKSLKKKWTSLRKADYTTNNDKIKKMPPKQRIQARKQLRERLKKKLAILVKQLPVAGKRTHSELDSLITKVNKLKWN